MEPPCLPPIYLPPHAKKPAPTATRVPSTGWLGRGNFAVCLVWGGKTGRFWCGWRQRLLLLLTPCITWRGRHHDAGATLIPTPTLTLPAACPSTFLFHTTLLHWKGGAAPLLRYARLYTGAPDLRVYAPGLLVLWRSSPRLSYERHRTIMM